MMDKLLKFDGNVLLWIQENIRNPVLDCIMKCFTRLGNGDLVWISFIVIMLLFKKTRRTGLITMFSMLGSLVVINLLIKNMVARTRPYDVVDGLTRIIGIQKDFSFPSGHAGHSFAAAIVIFVLMPRKYGISALIIATLISFSRLYVGVHYPSDVIAGAVIGTFVALITLAVAKKMQDRKQGKKQEEEQDKEQDETMNTENA